MTVPGLESEPPLVLRPGREAAFAVPAQVIDLHASTEQSGLDFHRPVGKLVGLNRMELSR
jgi:hypothetical protein